MVLRSVGGCNGCGNTGNLASGSDDLLSSRVTDVGDILVLPLSSLPDLDFTASSEHTDSHGGQEVVSGIGVVVDTTVEHGGGILANTRRDESPATGVLLDEVGDIVNDTGNRDESAAVLGLLLVGLPVDDGKLLQGNTPVEGLSLLVELLLELLETALLDFVLLELLEIRGQTELLPDPDAPLGRVILVPLDGIAVIRWEFVVEVVVPLSERDQSGDDVVPGRVAVIEWLVAEPVGEGVDAEGGLLDEEDAEDTSVDEAAEPVTPAETRDEAREDEAHEEDALEVVAVLPDHDGVVVQVGDVGTADTLGVLLHDHPSEVGVEQALSDGVGVLVGIGVAVVGTMVARPPARGALDGTRTDGGQEDSQRKRCGV